MTTTPLTQSSGQSRWARSEHDYNRWLWGCAGSVAWMRMMGRESVEYHLDTVAGRGDDYPGRALDYYASRGETPLEWG